MTSSRVRAKRNTSSIRSKSSKPFWLWVTKYGRTLDRHRLLMMCAYFSSTLFTSSAFQWHTQILISQACLRTRTNQLSLKRWQKLSRHWLTSSARKFWCTIWATSEEMKSLMVTLNTVSIFFKFCSRSAPPAWCRKTIAKNNPQSPQPPRPRSNLPAERINPTEVKKKRVVETAKITLVTCSDTAMVRTTTRLKRAQTSNNSLTIWMTKMRRKTTRFREEQLVMSLETLARNLTLNSIMTSKESFKTLKTSQITPINPKIIKRLIQRIMTNMETRISSIWLIQKTNMVMRMRMSSKCSTIMTWISSTMRSTSRTKRKTTKI